MGKNLIIKGADFSNVAVSKITPTPETEYLFMETLINPLTDLGEQHSGAYINTRVYGDDTTKVEIKFLYDKASEMGEEVKTCSIFGDLSTSGAKLSLSAKESAPGSSQWYGEKEIGGIITSKNVPHIVVLQPSHYSIDSEQQQDFSTASFQTTNPLGIFDNSNPQLSYKAKEVYYCKIWKDDTLVRDFVPVKRKSDGVCGMLDKVNQVFYTSVNDVSFIAR